MQFVLEVNTIEDGEEHTRKYNTDVFPVFGGKYKLRKAIENKIKEIQMVIIKSWLSYNSRDYTLTT